MMSPEELALAVAELDPDDGYSVELVENEMTLSLYLTFRLKGELHAFPGLDDSTDPVRLATWDKQHGQEDKIHGECDRTRLLAVAICRYMNTGGEPADFHDTVRMFRAVWPGKFGFDFGGRELASSVFGEDGFTHLFAKPHSDIGVCWTEGLSWDVCELEDVETGRHGQAV